MTHVLKYKLQEWLIIANKKIKSNIKYQIYKEKEREFLLIKIDHLPRPRYGLLLYSDRESYKMIISGGI